jgi:hypothetical protein
MTAPYPVFKLPEFTGFSERQWQVGCGDKAKGDRGFDRADFVDDFKPAVAESAQRVGVALVLLAMVL